jgi:lipopolysaccharide/colanic/teichoic acid biosynthesis glycosyltransferase
MASRVETDDPLFHIMAGDMREVLASHEERASRFFNFTIALAILLFVLPLMLVLAVVVFVTDPGPVIFAHRRIGKGGRHFYCLKFRSMVVDAEQRLAHLLDTDESARIEWARDHKLRQDPRLTPVGSFLRKTSLDDLPQLFNVLKGEMSLVGPRPIVDAERVRYGRYFAHYCKVLPGITGLWQVSGRNDVSYRRRVAFDVAYSRSRSLAFDARILLATIPCVLMARGSC